jgi:hypothetical protein
MPDTLLVTGHAFWDLRKRDDGPAKWLFYEISECAVVFYDGSGNEKDRIVIVARKIFWSGYAVMANVDGDPSYARDVARRERPDEYGFIRLARAPKHSDRINPPYVVELRDKDYPMLEAACFHNDVLPSRLVKTFGAIFPRVNRQDISPSRSVFVHNLSTGGGASGCPLIDRETREIVGIHNGHHTEAGAVPYKFDARRNANYGIAFDAKFNRRLDAFVADAN